MKKVIIGDTVKFTWISSGASPSAIVGVLYTGSETAVSSTTLTSSGNGHYYANITIPGTPGYYVCEINATISAKPYIRRQRVRAITGEVD